MIDLQIGIAPNVADGELTIGQCLEFKLTHETWVLVNYRGMQPINQVSQVVLIAGTVAVLAALFLSHCYIRNLIYNFLWSTDIRTRDGWVRSTNATSVQCRPPSATNSFLLEPAILICAV